MELFKRENGSTVQIFKILEKLQPNEGQYFYKYTSIIVNPLELKQMDDYLSEDDYLYIQNNYDKIQNDDLENMLSNRVTVSNKNGLYQEYLGKYLTCFKAKAKAREETKIEIEEKGGDFYEILIQKWTENNIYDLRSEVMTLRGTSKLSGNLLQQYVCDKAFKDAISKYLTNTLG